MQGRVSEESSLLAVNYSHKPELLPKGLEEKGGTDRNRQQSLALLEGFSAVRENGPALRK